MTEPAELGVVGLALVVLAQIVGPALKRSAERRKDSDPPSQPAMRLVMRDEDERREILHTLRALGAESKVRSEVLHRISEELRTHGRLLATVERALDQILDRCERIRCLQPDPTPHR